MTLATVVEEKSFIIKDPLLRKVNKLKLSAKKGQKELEQLESYDFSYFLCFGAKDKIYYCSGMFWGRTCRRLELRDWSRKIMKEFSTDRALNRALIIISAINAILVTRPLNFSAVRGLLLSNRSSKKALALYEKSFAVNSRQNGFKRRHNEETRSTLWLEKSCQVLFLPGTARRRDQVHS